MNSEIRPPAWFATAAAAAFAGGFLALWLTDYAVIRTEWCSGAETSCLRDWFGALSGWAAAVAASITIIVLIRQTKNIESQTEYVIGKSVPTAYFFRCNTRTVDLRITNWNRYPVQLLDIQISGVNKPIESKDIIISELRNGGQENVAIDISKPKIIIMPGWPRSGVEPCTVKVNAEIVSTTKTDIFQTIAATIKCRILAPEPREVTVEAFAGHEIFGIGSHHATSPNLST